MCLTVELPSFESTLDCLLINDDLSKRRVSLKYKGETKVCDLKTQLAELLSVEEENIVLAVYHKGRLRFPTDNIVASAINDIPDDMLWFVWRPSITNELKF